MQIARLFQGETIIGECRVNDDKEAKEFAKEANADSIKFYENNYEMIGEEKAFIKEIKIEKKDE